MAKQRSKHEGLMQPRYCPRLRADCEALSQIIAHNHDSFVCVGRNDGTTRHYQQDEYRFCVKGLDDIDEMFDCDRRDLLHQAGVINMALSIAEEGTSGDTAD